ncbi:MAG: hypothetical protein RIQ64_1714 [Actinomycetota bacterium]|jgi:ABC-type uncharacterized transport system permease subunit
MSEKVMPVRSPRWTNSVLVPFFAIAAAFVLGALIVMLAGTSWSDTLNAYRQLFVGSVGSAKAFSETLTAATPLILSGLAVAIAFRSGLFNIGGEGQIMAGGMCAVYAGFTFSSLPAFLHLPIALFAGVLGGALWGFVPGLLKARTGAHEVIVTIMMNFVALRLVDYFLKTTLFQREGRNDPVSKNIAESARLPHLLGWWDGSMRVHAGLIVALCAAGLVAWLLGRTTVGFEFRAVGSNADSAKYAGMSATKVYILAMMFAGGLAGLAGSSQVLGVLNRASPGFSANLGFDGIAVALLGKSKPWGVVASALLFGALRAGGQQMQARAGVGIDLVSVIQALVIIFIAAPSLVSWVFRLKSSTESGTSPQGRSS